MGETVGPTRYDLTAYKPARMWAIGATLATETDGDDEKNDEIDAPLGE